MYLDVMIQHTDPLLDLQFIVPDTIVQHTIADPLLSLLLFTTLDLLADSIIQKTIAKVKKLIGKDLLIVIKLQGQFLLVPNLQLSHHPNSHQMLQIDWKNHSMKKGFNNFFNNLVYIKHF